MDRQICAFKLFFSTQANANKRFQQAVNHDTTQQRPHHAHGGADQLRLQAHAAHAAKGFRPKNTRRNAAPRAAQTMQWPNAQHVVNLPFVLRPGEHDDKNRTGNATDDQRAQRMHDV